MPTQLEINQRLAAYGWTGLPVDHIVNRPGHLLAGMGNKMSLWKRLNRNVWRYARQNNWRWIPRAGDNGALNHAGPFKLGLRNAVVGAGTCGLPLLEGTNPQFSCNCGVFNTTVRQIAWHILGFADNEIGGASTPKTFVTRPGTRTFDAAWTGNVRTVAQDFPAVSAFKFTAHSWSKAPAGGFSDATCRVTYFGNETDIYWFETTPSKETLFNKPSNDWLEVNPVHNDALQLPAGGPPYFLIKAEALKKKASMFPAGGAGLTQVMINGVPDACATNNEWPNWWLLSMGDLPEAFRQQARYFFTLPGYAKG